MTWMLVAVVAGHPLATNMHFETLAACLATDEKVRVEVAEAFNEWRGWAVTNTEVSGFPESEAFMKNRIGLSNYYTCVPHQPTEAH